MYCLEQYTWKTREITFKGTYNHVNLMYVIFALDQVLNLPMVLCGIEEKYRKRTEGKLKTASDYLLNPNNSLTSSVDVFNSAI